MATKSCLKQTSSRTSPIPEFHHHPLASGESSPTPVSFERRKSVTFVMDDKEEVKEEVFYADEWDRSAVQATRKLSYRDVLELMELKLSLPRIRLSGGRNRSSSVDSDKS
ncbi:hypothetical protein WOLCODRAFT_165192 [Wolfiporia cocos MD-104 SS10]|uniref:Uncharacterized protein n=1 Tax=Wolfiporia cocos (strain MD-104) TaxID=742152 RepID=A0A2H3JQS0_WOLCO|nr:hypothetical protein WOLCODRAFT_165192 [Wolfiporia cocos MD-104 SS10]